MARAELTVRATTSNAIPFQLLAGTAPLDLTGYGTIELHLKDRAGGTQVHGNVTNGNKLTIPSYAQGSVTLTPGTGDLVAGSAPYQGYFKVYINASSWFMVPEDSEFTINVRETF